MRVPSLLGPAAAGVLAFSSTVRSLTFSEVSIPELDLSSLGRVTITGDFDGVSLYSYEGQTENTKTNGPQSILTPLPNGILTNISSSDGVITTMCSFTQEDGTFAGIFVGGNFTTLGGVDTPGAALFNPNTTQVTALPGLSGSVAAAACDQTTNRIYVGGDLKHDNTTNALAWVPGQGWQALPFDGLNGPVTSILQAENGHIIFGGSFSGIGNSSSSSSSSSHGMQVVNLQTADISSNDVSTLNGYKDPRNVVCSTSGVAGEGQTWLLYDASPGYWQAYFDYEIQPAKIRLYNTQLDGRGTKSFLLQRLPDDGIMNLTYTDSNGNQAYCDQSCPLSHTEKYQDFELVNPVTTGGFMLQILDWYGQGAGLNGIEVFSNIINSYAIDSYNEPTCAGIDFPSKSTRTGSWTVESGYVSASVTSSDSSDTAVTFVPDIKESGQYNVTLYTPGCDDDGSCGSRGVVQVDVDVSTDSGPLAPVFIYQTNDDDKYDTIYTGYVDASSNSFRPKVTLKAKPGSGAQTVVASSVQFVPLFNTSKSDNSSHSGGGTRGLNGLYDYNPNSVKADTTHLKQDTINKVGDQLGHSASILSMAESNDVVYVGGNFSDSTFGHVMSINDGKATAMPDGGLNSKVSAMVTLDDVLYVGGLFTNTANGGADGLQYVASYSSSSNSWSPLGAGLNGPVDSIYPIQLNVSTAISGTTIAVSGDFTQISASNSYPAVAVDGFAIWVPSQKAWLQNLNVTQMEFAGHLSAVVSVNNTSILAGNVATDGLASSGAVSLQNPTDLSLVPLSMHIDDAKSSSSKGLVNGVYDTSSGRNLTILGGHFIAENTNGSTIENLVFLDGADESLSGLPQGINSTSTFISMIVSNNTLWAAGNITGSVGSSTIGGLVAYDLTDGVFVSPQPAALNGVVNTVVTRPGSSDIYVGGDFSTAGVVPCAAVCSYDPTQDIWSWPGVNLDGTVLALEWTSSDEMIAIGDLNVDGNKSVVATWSSKNANWASFPGASTSDIPGDITAFTPASEDISTFWLGGTSTNGSAFLLSYDGKNFNSPGSLFSHGTVIRGLEVLPVIQDHDSVSTLNDDQTLLVMGDLKIPGFGDGSAALFNGTAVTPFILSTQSNGQPGIMSQLFSEKQNPYSNSTRHHSNGIVVLVAFCCALGCVFLIVVAGVILNKIQRRRQGYTAAPQSFGTDRPSDMQRVPPEYLFNSLHNPQPGAPTV
ncbi:uncharacterized protein PFLUO_LOCUS6471 [Penicillium psychrofluorescens]|uniref:uncharacterized protein n=1 Tax=Penicillium psychrofluorescens TaxID=3158075 RepID=UPI003CCD0F2A